MARSCNGCTMCCKLMAVSELQKPANEWCTHCIVGAGCGLHETIDLPMSCATFKCLWLMNESLPEELRPDRSRVVIYPHDDMLHVLVDPPTRDAWEKPLLLSVLQHINDKGLDIVIVAGNARKMLPGRGKTGMVQIRETL